jgi:methylmalonyl-CoA mutase
MAIQLIITKEMGSPKMKTNQGSFIIEELTDLEKRPSIRIDRITERGGVLGAMETMYQRSKIQERKFVL